MYIGLRDVPVVGNIRIGNVKEPLRLEMLTSSKYISFMERSLISDYAQQRNNGILVMNDFIDDRFSFQVGLFRNANGNADDVLANDGYVFTGRLTGLPIHNENQLLHLGFSYSYRKPETQEYSVKSRPESHLSSLSYINTGTIPDVQNINIVNLEAAFVAGAFSTQAEWLSANVNATDNTYNFTGYYGQIGYFLTGEHKKYKGSYEGFDRIKPKQNFMGKNGPGAWEAALRYSFSDLNSGMVAGGEQSDITLGLNWYLNPVTRFMFNYIWEDIKSIGNAKTFEVRFQIDF